MQITLKQFISKYPTAHFCCCIPNSASTIHSSALVVLAVRHWPYRAVPLWYWQSDIGHTEQCPCGTGRHRPYRAVPLWYWHSDIGHTEQCPCGTGSQTSAIQSSALAVLADIGHTEQCPCGSGSQTSAIQSSALAVLAVRQQNIYCSPAPSTSHSERESGQTTLL